METGKRILSILLTALLLALNLATAAQAAVSCNGNHEWGNWLGAGATCDSPGSQRRTCRRCGAVDTRDTPALGHSWNGGAVTAQPSCTSGGTRVYTCTRCGQTRTEGIGALGHSYGGVQVTKPSTCATMGESFQVCSRCGDRITHVMPKNENHSWDEGVITKEPDGFTPGEKTYTCTLCGATRTEEVEPATALFSGLNSFLSGGNFRNNIMSNPLGDDILHIVEQPQGGSIPHDSYTVLSVAAEGGEEPYTYEWWYEPTGLFGAGVSPSALVDLVYGVGQATVTTVQQNRNDVKNATIVSTSEWLSKHIASDGTAVSLTDKTAQQAEQLDAKSFNPLAKCLGSTGNPECNAWTAGNYWCIVYDSAGHHVTSNEAKVTDALYIVAQPESKNIFGIGSATLTCRAGGGSGSYLYNWHDKDGNLLSDEASYTTDQEGDYQCIVYDNMSLDIAESNWVQVYSADLRPVITLHPSNVKLKYRQEGGYSATFTCEAVSPATGDDSNLDYEWEIYSEEEGWRYAGLTYKTLSFSDVQPNTTCRCKVIDRNTGEYVYSNTAMVMIMVKMEALSASTQGYTGSDYEIFSFDIQGGTAPYTVYVYEWKQFPDPSSDSGWLRKAVVIRELTINDPEELSPLVLELPRQVTEYVYIDGILKSGNAHPCYFIVVVDATGQACQSKDIYAE